MELGKQPGRTTFTRNIPQDLGFVKRYDDNGNPTDKFFDYEITETCGKKLLGKIENTDNEKLLKEYHVI